MRTALILNPNSGSAEVAADLSEKLAALGPVETFESSPERDCAQLAAAALEQGFERIIAAGGDGTVNEVLNGLSADFGGALLGVLPLGTGNDLARSLNIPLDLDGAVRALAEGREQRIDVLRLTPLAAQAAPGPARYFVNASGGGVSVKMSDEMSDNVKDWWGSLAYMVNAVAAIPTIESFRATFRFEDDPEEQRDIHNLVVANGRTIGGGIPIAPRASLSDGYMDVVLVGDVGVARLALLMPRVLAGAHLEHEDVFFRQTRRFEIRCEPPLPINVDGESLGPLAARYEVLPGVLRVLRGPEEPAASPAQA